MNRVPPQPRRAPAAAPRHTWLQPKLAIGTPGDRFEQEADQAAARVLAGHGRPTLTPLAAPPLQREGEEDKKKEPPGPIGEGLATVGKNLGENNPAFSTFSEQLAAKFLAQPAPISVGIPAFLGANYAFLWGMALVNPAMRRSFDDFNLAMLPGLVPQFPVKTFQYRILDSAQTRFAFDLGLDASKLMTAFNEGVLNTRVSSLKFDTGGKLDTKGPKPLALSSMQVQLGLFGDGVLLSGGFRNGISPYPLMGDDGSRVMAQTPALPDLYANQRDVRFTLQLDLVKLAGHFGSPPPPPRRAPEQLQREASDTATVDAPTAASAVQSTLANAGAPLDAGTRGFMQSRFGHDFGRVRIHADAGAAASARAVAAHAYTVGPHIAFASGRYAPHTAEGRRLLAHELAHVVQQGGGATLLQRDEDEAERKKQEAARDEARKRLETWAQGKASPPSTKPTDKSFAFTAQERAFEITHDKSFNLLPKPTDKKLVAGWQAAFRDAYQLALMILDSSGTDQREERAGMIGVDLATAGFTNEAMAIAARLPAEKQKHIFEEVVKAPASASAAQIRTISTFSVGTAASLSDHLLLAALTDRSGAYAKLLGKDRLLAALEPTLAKYRAEADYVEALAEILVFHRDGRVPLSEWLWKTDKAFLFEILQTKYFVEPGYGPGQFADAAGTARELTMADDMPWVYTYKQKYYVELLVALGAKHTIDIKAPKDLRFATLRAWLEAQTAHIGQALAAEYPEAPDQITQAYARIADIFFFHVDRGDVTPDLAGHLGTLGPADPSGMRLKSDCDVLATYATRLLRGAGFTPVGYLAVLPGVGDGHAVALLKRTQRGKPEAKDKPAQPAVETHYIVNNKQVKPIAVKTKEEGIQAALADALLIYSGTPETYRVFYEDAAADGAMTRDLWTTVERVHRRDLDKTAPASPP